MAFLRIKMVLYSNDNYQSHVLRFLLYEKRLKFDCHRVSELPEDLRALTPTAHLPLLIDRDVALYEPFITFEYLEESYPAARLLPMGSRERARVRLLAWRIYHDWIKPARVIWQHPDSFDDAKASLAKKHISDSLATLSPLFAKKLFFLSPTPSICDILLMPFLYRLPTLDLTLTRRHTAPIFDYYQRHVSRPSFTQSLGAST